MPRHVSGMTRQQVAELQERVGADDIQRHGDREFTVRLLFFYTGGKTSEDFAQRVIREVPGAVVLDQGEVWRPFKGGASTRRQSHWWVRFVLPKEREDGGGKLEGA